MSTHISCVDAQKSLDQLCNQVIESKEAVIITRPDGQNVALISEAESKSISETLYLLQLPANAIRLLTAMKRAEAGSVLPQTVEELCEQLGLEEDADDIAAAS